MIRLLLAWAAIMALLLLQLASVALHLHGAASLLGLVATAIVLLAFMRIRQGSGLMRLFAAAGLLWLVVLLGLGNLDPWTRVDYPAPTTTNQP